jgi:predicted metal-dependent phosphoesterase TrpH
MVERGTHFRKADLHIHTPASTCYSASEKHITAAEIIAEVAKKNLELIGVTDHNNIAFLEDIVKEAQKRGIIVFPGIEVTAREAHILALFDPNYPLQKLNDFLPQIGIKMDQRGKAEAIASSMEEVIKVIDEYGGIAIAAHANSSSGLLQNPRGQYKIKIYKMPELHALELTAQDDINKFSKGLLQKYPAKACICGSDAHCLTDIGQRYTYIKMDNISIIGLHQALADWQVRVKFPWDTIKTCCPRIKDLTVNQGFFEGATFEL